VLPKQVLTLCALAEKAAAGDVRARRRAQELEQALMVLSTFDEGPDLVLYYKFLMTLEGDTAYERHFNRDDRLSASQERFAREAHAQFKRWWAAWSAEA
jgi:4-hydroxy-tetrahydrodipicolinate synthase